MALNDQPKITVIVAVMNAKATLQRCLDSFWAQTYPWKEIIVIDGGSSDGSLELLNNVAERLDFYVSEPDKGIYDAWNKALSHVTGDWVVFLGADDYLWSETTLADAAQQLNSLPEDVYVGYGKVAVIGLDGSELNVKGESWDDFKEKFFAGQMFPHQGVFHRGVMFAEFGTFDDRFRIAGDYDLLLRVLKAKKAAFLSELTVAGWQVGGISYDVSTALKTAREYSLARTRNQQNRPSLYLSVFYLKAYVLHLLCVLFGREVATRVACCYRKSVGEWR